jgi:OOP family OmpA-OmpF porin
MQAADAAVAIRAGLLAGAMSLALVCGPAPAQEAAAVATPPTPACADQDEDRDGVNQCLDQCPASRAGEAIGPDGCAVPVAIDLSGVNFDYNDAALRPDARAALDEAALLLAKYPQLRVEVASHTDSVGTREYNQRLSERRAKAVYDYLVAHGVDRGRLLGPTGYGESRPIAPNTLDDGSDNPEGRAKNRRTELNVQE